MSYEESIIDKEIDFLAEKIRMRVAEEKMTPLQRSACLVTGEIPDRMPVFAMGTEWAAHYIGYKLDKDFAWNAKKWVHAALIGVSRIGCDLCGPMYDIYNIGPDAMGAEILFSEDAMPVVRRPTVRTPEDLDKLKIPDPRKDGRMPVALESIKLAKEKIGDIVPIWALVNGPFSWAANLRGIYDYIADLKRNPKFAHDLLEIVTKAVIKYVKAILDLGIKPIILADAACTTYLVSPKQMEDYGVWSYRQIEEAIGKETFQGSLMGDFETQARLFKMGVPSFLGFTNYCYCDRTGTEPLREKDILEQKRFAKELSLPNVVLLWGQWVQVHSPREITEEVKRIIKLTGPDWPFLVGAWMIPLGTPIENVDALVCAIKTYGKFPIQI